MKCTGLSVTGKNRNNSNHISGKFSSNFETQEEIKNLKKTILNKIILPILSRKWKKIEENLFTFEKMKNQIDIYHKYYNAEDLLIYKDVLKA